MASKRSQEVANAFDKDVREGNRSLIESFSDQEIERTLIEYSADKGMSFYDAMERRLTQLKEIQAQERETVRDKSNLRQRKVDRLVGFASGILLLLIGQWMACG